MGIFTQGKKSQKKIAIKPRLRVTDVFFDPKRNTVYLGDTSKQKKLSNKKIYAKVNHWMGEHSVSLLLFCIIIFGALFYVNHSNFIHADTVTFYPSTCLGGWKNSQLAEGQPDVTVDSGQFNINNSAVLPNNSISQIFCGDFSGTITEDSKKDTQPKKIILHFSWALTDTPPPDETGVTISSPDFASSTDDIINIPDNTNSQFILTPDSSSTPSPIPASDSSVSNPSTDPQVPVPPPSDQSNQTTTPTDSPTSFLDFFIPTAYAQDMGNTVSTSSQEATVIDSTNIASSTGITTQDQSDEPFVEVFYTTDGNNWKSLGTVSRKDFSNSQFELPLSSFSSWQDLSKLQISIQRLSTVNQAPFVYLDALSLDIEYTNTPPTIPDVSNDPTKIHVRNIQNNSGDIALHVSLDDNNDEQLGITSISSLLGLVMYNTDTGDLVLNTFISEEHQYAVSVSYFDSGNYTAIKTSDPSLCADKTLDECRRSKDFVAESTFTVVPIASTTGSQ